jgi:hypothetical protein
MAAQLPDFIVIDGDRQDLYSNPLEQYWIVNKLRRPSFLSSFDCKRGYVATWELLDNHLVLKEVTGAYQKRYFYFWKRIKPCSLRSILRKSALKDLRATWFTGKIRVPKGSRIYYVHHDYESRFEQEMILTIEHGKVIKSIVLDYTHETLQVASNDRY